MKLWDKGYNIDALVETFTVGIDHILDKQLVKYDCEASKAHAEMLAKIGILTKTEAKKISKELDTVIKLAKKNEFAVLREDEDCHTAIEKHLTEKLGDLGKKIHTARSRNDQVLTALRLYYKDELDACEALTHNLIITLTDFVRKYGKIVIPGYTHTRKAMPSSVGLWAQAIIESMQDNIRQLRSVYSLIDQSPLGSAAGYGVPLKINRSLTAKLLGFKKVQKNPIYVQSSRGKFESAILHTLGLLLYDLNRVATDLIIFSMPVLGYFSLPDHFTTGSSIMPQKKNPDVLELLRAQYAIILGYENQVKGLAANLITGYHRDLQLSKEPVMKGFEIARKSLQIADAVFANLGVNEENCKKAMSRELYATEEVYKLVEAGMPFREAYKRVAKEFL